MNAKTILGIAVAAGLSACSAPPLISPPRDIVETAEEIKSEPAAGVTASAATGDNLYSERTVRMSRTSKMTLQQPAQAIMDLGHRLELPAGKEGQLSKTSNGGQPSVCFLNITKPGMGGPGHACLVDRDNDGSFDNAMFMSRDRFFPLSQPAKYTITKDERAVVTEEKSAFQREILYQGVSKGTIKLSFREYLGDMARPAFTQDILYDLEADGTATVVFKGLRVKVLKATGTTIQYIVERPFASR